MTATASIVQVTNLTPPRPGSDNRTWVSGCTTHAHTAARWPLSVACGRGPEGSSSAPPPLPRPPPPPPRRPPRAAGPPLRTLRTLRPPPPPTPPPTPPPPTPPPPDDDANSGRTCSSRLSTRPRPPCVSNTSTSPSLEGWYSRRPSGDTPSCVAFLDSLGASA
jgi:hypothetical protein